MVADCSILGNDLQVITVGVLQVSCEESQGVLPNSFQHTAQPLKIKTELAQGESQV